ncbi:MAG: hypothetical protein ABL989_11235 [Gammaproteobacteria bacterium]
MIRPGNPVRVKLAAMLLATVPVAPAFAYWELTPQVEGGITYETNPRYLSDEEESVVLALNPDAADNVMGVYFDLRLEGTYKTPSTQIALTPRIRETNYLKSNKDLNDDDWYVDFLAAHTGVLGNVSLRSSYQETGVRTTEFESAVPDNPDAPLPVSGGSGRFSDDTQQTWNIEPALNYQLSPRNLVGLTGQYSDTTYDEQRENLLASRSYLDYNYSSLELSLRHVLDSKNYFAVALNSGNFLAEEPDRLFKNSTDSFGITAAYNRSFSETLTGTLTVGITRSSVDVSGIVGGFDPLTGAPCLLTDPCATSNEERNFVGSLELRKRSEGTTLNFSLGSQIAPRSDGTEVVQEQVRLFVDRVFTQKLSGSLGLLYSTESAVGQIFQPETASFGLARQDRNYFTIEPRISWRLTETLSVYSSYIYVSDTTDVTGGNVEQTNNRLYFGVLYRGVGLRR